MRQGQIPADITKPSALPSRDLSARPARHNARPRHPGSGFFPCLAALLALLAIFPLLALAVLATGGLDIFTLEPPGAAFRNSLYVTFILLASVGLVTLVIGTGTAWLVTMCAFPGRGFFGWALVLPLAIPPYIAAFAWVEMLDYSGPVQSTIRALFGFRSPRDYAFPEIRSTTGAIMVMSCVTFPYIYLTARAAFMLQSRGALEISRTLGASATRMFFQIALPMVRPALVAGVALALMECINDIGAVTFLGVRTLTLSVYDTWLNRSDLAGAARIACSLLILVVALLYIERRARRGRSFDSADLRPVLPRRYRLSPGACLGAILACLVPVILGFVLPVMQLFGFSARRIPAFFDPETLDALGNSLFVSFCAAVMITAAALAIGFGLRMRRAKWLAAGARVAAVGYAVPGTVLAIGILIPLAAFDNFVDLVFRSIFNISTGLVLIGSGAALVYACSVRFLAVALGQVEAGLGKIPVRLDMVARTLGKSQGWIFFQIHLPLLRPVVMSAFLMAFVECMKELPATLLLRPFNFETLATLVYNDASRAAYGDAAPPALMIVAAGLVPVIWLVRMATPVGDMNPRPARSRPGIPARGG